MFQVDNQSRYPVYEQIMRQIERYVLTGIFLPGEKIPSVRSLSLQMNLNPNTVQRSYTELDRKGVIYTSSGIGTFIAERAPEILKKERHGNIQTLRPTIRDFAISGIPKAELTKMIDEIYEEESK